MPIEFGSPEAGKILQANKEAQEAAENEDRYRYVECVTCKGTGVCAQCNGTGRYIERNVEHECDCGGWGCNGCDGEGTLEQQFIDGAWQYTFD